MTSSAIMPQQWQNTAFRKRERPAARKIQELNQKSKDELLKIAGKIDFSIEKGSQK